MKTIKMITYPAFALFAVAQLVPLYLVSRGAETFDAAAVRIRTWSGHRVLLHRVNGALLAIITVMLWLAPVQRPSWRGLLPGALLATAIWIVSSAGFAFFTATFDNYNKTWGSLSAVIVTLVWLWLTSLALLLGAELNAEAARRVRSSEA